MRESHRRARYELTSRGSCPRSLPLLFVARHMLGWARGCTPTCLNSAHRIRRRAEALYFRAGDDPVRRNAAVTRSTLLTSVTAFMNCCAALALGHRWRPISRSCASAASGLTGSVSVVVTGLVAGGVAFVSGTAFATGCGYAPKTDGRRWARFASSGFVSNARANLCAGVSDGHLSLPILVSSAHAAAASFSALSSAPWYAEFLATWKARRRTTP